jgi:alanyl aminopeptidase
VRRSPTAFLLALAVVSSCGGPPARVGSAPSHGSGSGAESPRAVQAPPPPRDDGRLPPTARPLRYALSLRIDPKQARFSGATSIQVDVPEPTMFVVLHARDMNVSRALARVGGSEVKATATTRIAHGGVVPEELVLAFARPLPAGAADVEIDYDAPFAPDLAGLYRVEEAGRMYAYTQFEVADARRAFPCFDEPGFKTPYDVTIIAPAEALALANSPETSHEAAADGTVVHHFSTSHPLPSYLVAFAVGDFDVVEWRKDPFPIRAVTTKGRANLAGLAL